MKGIYNSVEQTLNTYRRKLDCSISKVAKRKQRNRKHYIQQTIQKLVANI